MDEIYPEDECDFEESNGVYILEDCYESLTEDKKKILSQLTISDEKINILKNENKQKLNKMKLLLYQKFLNIFFSILYLNIRKDFKLFLEKIKIFKLKNLGYNLDPNNKKFKCPDFYVKSLMKQMERKEKLELIKHNHENFKKVKKDEEKVKVKPNDYEVEYKKHMEKMKLEKLKKEEKKKNEQDLINKQTYADNIYAYLIKRKMFRILILNNELNKVSLTFIENIFNKMLKKKYIDKLNFIYSVRQKRKYKIEQLKFDHAIKFYMLNLKTKIFRFLMENYEINLKMQSYYIKAFKVKRKRIASNKFYKILKLFYYNLLKRQSEIRKRIAEFHKLLYSKIFMKGLKINQEESKDKKLKEDLIRKLKDKASFLIGDFNN